MNSAGKLSQCRFAILRRNKKCIVKNGNGKKSKSKWKWVLKRHVRFFKALTFTAHEAHGFMVIQMISGQIRKDHCIIDYVPTQDNTVPDLVKLSTREVLRRVRGQDLNVKFVGQGLVSEVVPAAGSALPEDKNITVILR